MRTPRQNKYLVIKEGVFEIPFIFPDIYDHMGMANRLKVRKDSILSAGFCEIRGDCEHVPGDLIVSAWGGSKLLNVSSRDEDREIIRNLFLKPEEF